MKLTDSSGASVEFTDDLEWVDELSYTPVAQSYETSVMGSLLVQEGMLTAGRPVTLVGGGDVWVDYKTVKALREMLTKTGLKLTLVSGDVISVKFRHQDTPIEAMPIQRRRSYDDTAKFTLTLRFMEL
ncbi:hypothetical protein A134_23140 [Vibrio crassostreae 9CS106]|uniref:Phage tail protein n=1 Tax=Vibrio crassostreae 9CS106 TaxID=1191300 RepID=A0A1B1C3E9_9VIBR|nr:hypothetical protein A134_23140 [Vibrio crassostreae 9CS106]